MALYGKSTEYYEIIELSACSHSIKRFPSPSKHVEYDLTNIVYCFIFRLNMILPMCSCLLAHIHRQCGEYGPQKADRPKLCHSFRYHSSNH